MVLAVLICSCHEAISQSQICFQGQKTDQAHRKSSTGCKGHANTTADISIKHVRIEKNCKHRHKHKQTAEEKQQNVLLSCFCACIGGCGTICQMRTPTMQAQVQEQENFAQLCSQF